MKTADLALVVALYAALVSTVALGWQIYVRVQQRRPDVRVSLNHGAGVDFAVPTGGPVVPGPLAYDLEVLVINFGERMGGC